MTYFCNGCLKYWKMGKFMDGCKECAAMEKTWGDNAAAKALEVWEPIVTWCRENNRKAWVKTPNTYCTRLHFSGSDVAMPIGVTPFWNQQKKFVEMYNNNRTKANWSLLHPETQRSNIHIRL